jgi:hypothetical protein
MLSECINAITSVTSSTSIDAPSDARLPPLFWTILRACRDLVKRGDPLVSFFDYVTMNPLCQFLPQHLAIESWLRTVLRVGVGEPFVVSTSHTMTRNHFLDEHSVHLMAFFAHDAKIGSDMVYRFTEADTSMSLTDMTLFQASTFEELNWNQLWTEWSSFPFSAHVFMQLLSVYHAPLKLVWVMEPSSLFSLLEFVTSASHNDMQRRALGSVFTSPALLELSEYVR